MQLTICSRRTTLLVVTDKTEHSLPEPLHLLVNLGEAAIRASPARFTRSLGEELRPRRRLLIARGPRGVGKTTLLQQYARENLDPARRAYLSLDDVVFRDHRLVDAVHELRTAGRDQLVLDEIHRYPDWEVELKNCYDRYPEVRILATGSSMLELHRGGGDLSRRAYVLDVPPLSFREYLELRGELSYGPLAPEALLRDHEAVHEELERLHGDLARPYGDYLRAGAYPALALAPDDAPGILRSVAVQVIDRDIAPTLALRPQTVAKLHRLLAILAASVPFKPTISKLAAQLETSRELIVELLDALDRAGLIRRFWAGRGGDNRLSKPDKVYLADVNLCHAFHALPNRGTLRETFFFGALPPALPVALPKRGDFLVGDSTFEVGGPGKAFSQVAEAARGYLAVETFDRGRGHRIPLYLFGFLR